MNYRRLLFKHCELARKSETENNKTGAPAARLIKALYTSKEKSTVVNRKYFMLQPMSLPSNEHATSSSNITMVTDMNGVNASEILLYKTG